MKNESITEAKEFKLTDEEYNGFKEFLKDKDYSYETGTEKALEELKDIAENEKYFGGSEVEFEALKKKLEPNNDNDLEKFKGEIKELLEGEIVSRYYFQNGRIEASLARDPYIEEGLRLMRDQQEFSGILEGTDKK